MTPFDSIAAFIEDTAYSPQRRGDSVAQALARARADNPLRHIYTRLLDSPALNAADGPQRRAPAPLLGVPFAIKDNIDVAGEQTSCGRRLDAGPAPADAAIVAQLRSLGAIPIGKTNLDEAALGASGRNSRFGRCHNPRGVDRLSGGSSSGSAAAVAAGHVLFGIGTDTLGSVRIPAAFCEIVGFKPSYGRLALAGVAPLYPRFDTLGLLAGSLADITRLAGLLLQHDTEPRPMPPGELRLGVLDDAALADVAADVAEAYRHCVRMLRSSRCDRIGLAPPIQWSATARAALWEVAHQFARRSAAAMPGYQALDDIGGELKALLERAASRSAARLTDGGALIEDASRQLRHCLIDMDAVLTPTCPQNAPPVAQDPAKNIAAFVAPANLCGLPAVAWTQRLGVDVSLSLQLIGRPGEDLRLLSLASQLQRLLD